MKSAGKEPAQPLFDGCAGFVLPLIIRGRWLGEFFQSTRKKSTLRARRSTKISSFSIIKSQKYKENEEDNHRILRVIFGNGQKIPLINQQI